MSKTAHCTKCNAVTRADLKFREFVLCVECYRLALAYFSLARLRPAPEPTPAPPVAQHPSRLNRTQLLAAIVALAAALVILAVIVAVWS